MNARLWITAAAVAALTAGCASSTNSSAPPSRPAGGSSAPGATAAAIAVKGGHLVAGDGKTLYFNSVDTTKVIKCVGACASIWPPLMGAPSVGAGLAKGSFSTTGRPDGSTQVAYLGHPLYEFSGDTGPGTTNGNGMPDSGGTWTVAKTEPAGESSPAAPSLPPPSDVMSTAGGGYGYP
jgi:predicted lipoprotein with Yx(FWY)xxD motif